MTGTSAHYLEEIYFQWQLDPDSVDTSWDAFFRSGQYAASSSPSDKAPRVPIPSPRSPGNVFPPRLARRSLQEPMSAHTAEREEPFSKRDATLLAKVVQLVRNFQVRGHFLANIDPLGLNTKHYNKELVLEEYGISDADLDKTVDLSTVNLPMKGFLDNDRNMTVRQIYNRLLETYCGHIGYEYMHIPDVDKCNWIREKIETIRAKTYDRPEKN